MHVFIDTNILLNFYHFTKDELDALQNIFASHEHGAAIVHLTQQVYDEFKRNRENRIKDALKRFTNNHFVVQLPSFMKAYGEYGEIKKLSARLQALQKDILEKAGIDISDESLLADHLIGEIFEHYEVLDITDETYLLARKRFELGNPPGKNNSIGDAINWVVLLYSVPDNEDIHVISEDGDFFSVLDEKAPHPFLANEWKEKKQSQMFVYQTLSDFMSVHFDGVAFSFDKDKEVLIEHLAYSGSFAQTHGIIAKLEEYSYFSQKEVIRILDAANENDQFGWIITDPDVSDFLNRIAVPHSSQIVAKNHLDIIQSVIDEQKERKENV